MSFSNENFRTCLNSYMIPTKKIVWNLWKNYQKYTVSVCMCEYKVATLEIFY